MRVHPVHANHFLTSSLRASGCQYLTAQFYSQDSDRMNEWWKFYEEKNFNSSRVEMNDQIWPELIFSAFPPFSKNLSGLAKTICVELIENNHRRLSLRSPKRVSTKPKDLKSDFKRPIIFMHSRHTRQDKFFSLLLLLPGHSFSTFYSHFPLKWRLRKTCPFKSDAFLTKPVFKRHGFLWLRSLSSSLLKKTLVAVY